MTLQFQVDFGCGSGSLLDSILSYPTSLEKIVGVDISQRALAKAAKVKICFFLLEFHFMLFVKYVSFPIHIRTNCKLHYIYSFDYIFWIGDTCYKHIGVYFIFRFLCRIFDWFYFVSGVFLPHFYIWAKVKALILPMQLLHSKLNRLSDSNDPSSKIKSAVLYDGSITNFDSRLRDIDIATCLEVLTSPFWQWLNLRVIGCTSCTVHN